MVINMWWRVSISIKKNNNILVNNSMDDCVWLSCDIVSLWIVEKQSKKRHWLSMTCLRLRATSFSRRMIGCVQHASWWFHFFILNCPLMQSRWDRDTTCRLFWMGETTLHLNGERIMRERRWIRMQAPGSFLPSSFMNHIHQKRPPLRWQAPNGCLVWVQCGLLGKRRSFENNNLLLCTSPWVIPVWLVVSLQIGIHALYLISWIWLNLYFYPSLLVLQALSTFLLRRSFKVDGRRVATTPFERIFTPQCMRGFKTLIIIIR